MTDTQEKDWRNAGDEIERIGRRLDAVRSCLKQAKKLKCQWAINHWQQTESNLVARWRLTIMLKDTGLKQAHFRPKQIVSYNWFELSEEAVFQSWFDRWPFNLFEQAKEESRIQQGFTASWEKRRMEILQKAKQGLI